MDSNGHELLKKPVDGIIVVDLDLDNIRTPGAAPSNFPLITIVGGELKGFVFTRDGLPDRLVEYESLTDLQWFVLRPVGDPVLVRHNSADVPGHAKIVVEGYFPDTDAVLGRWNHFAVWRRSDKLGVFALHVALFIESAAP